jgi:hypothetical protein
MSEEIRRDRWQIYFNEFSKRNQSRPTRLQIFGEMGVREEERFLPLNGISVEETGHNAPQIEIMLGGSSPNDERHLTHMIPLAKQVIAKSAAEGIDEALKIQDGDGVKTLLRFETLPEPGQ